MKKTVLYLIYALLSSSVLQSSNVNLSEEQLVCRHCAAVYDAKKGENTWQTATLVSIRNDKKALFVTTGYPLLGSFQNDVNLRIRLHPFSSREKNSIYVEKVFYTEDFFKLSKKTKTSNIKEKKLAEYALTQNFCFLQIASLPSSFDMEPLQIPLEIYSGPKNKLKASVFSLSATYTPKTLCSNRYYKAKKISTDSYIIPQESITSPLNANRERCKIRYEEVKNFYNHGMNVFNPDYLFYTSFSLLKKHNKDYKNYSLHIDLKSSKNKRKITIEDRFSYMKTLVKSLEISSPAQVQYRFTEHAIGTPLIYKQNDNYQCYGLLSNIFPIPDIRYHIKQRFYEIMNPKHNVLVSYWQKQNVFSSVSVKVKRNISNCTEQIMLTKLNFGYTEPDATNRIRQRFNKRVELLTKDLMFRHANFIYVRFRPYEEKEGYYQAAFDRFVNQDTTKKTKKVLLSFGTKKVLIYEKLSLQKDKVTKHFEEHIKFSIAPEFIKFSYRAKDRKLKEVSRSDCTKVRLEDICVQGATSIMLYYCIQYYPTLFFKSA